MGRAFVVIYFLYLSFFFANHIFVLENIRKIYRELFCLGSELVVYQIYINLSLSISNLLLSI